MGRKCTEIPQMVLKVDDMSLDIPESLPLTEGGPALRPQFQGQGLMQQQIQSPGMAGLRILRQPLPEYSSGQEHES
jgi:hypothetical protein